VSEKLEFAGERFLPGASGEISQQIDAQQHEIEWRASLRW